MSKGLSKDRLELFNLVVQNLGTALKNSVLYSSDHPIFAFSVRNFKDSLDKWLAAGKDLTLGISTDSILLGGEFIDKKSELYREVAEYMHSRGVLAISFARGVELEELEGILKFLKEDVRTIREKGGIEPNIPPMPHISVKGIDYSSLLEGIGTEITPEEEEIWNSLTEISTASKIETLPESKKEFIANFLKDTKRASHILNKVYKEAIIKLQDEETVRSMRESIARIYDYFSKGSDDEREIARGNIGKLISRLDPDLVVRLFDPAVIDGADFDLAREIVKDLSDEFLAEFIGSLMGRHDRFNENILKVLDKLVPGGARASNVASLVAGRMIDRNLLSSETLTEMQMSIKEVFGNHPDSNFMSEMYKLTVETFVDRKVGSTTFSRRLVPLVEEYVKAVRKEGLKRQEAELLLNIIWHEDDPGVFIRFSERFISIIPDLLELKDTERIRQAFELFSEDLRPEQKKDPEIRAQAERSLRAIDSHGLLEKLISFIPVLEMKALEDTISILDRSSFSPAKPMLDAFILENDVSKRNKLGFVIAGLHRKSADEIVASIAEAPPSLKGELFSILRKVSYEKSRTIAMDLIRHKDPVVREQALEGFVPVTDREKKMLISLIVRERSGRVRRKAIRSLLKTDDADVINALFRSAERRFFDRGLLLDVVRLAGETASKKAVPKLARLFLRKRIFERKEDLRMAALVSLGKIRDPPGHRGDKGRAG
jgi:hypothetical protein